MQEANEAAFALRKTADDFLMEKDEEKRGPGGDKMVAEDIRPLHRRAARAPDRAVMACIMCAGAFVASAQLKMLRLLMGMGDPSPLMRSTT
ncbi:hypothetical protein DIPPA_20448 [Diplonema papillatum]|nr:hypothetical protein DIPPA_20448 [Diplonema papillatum]